MTDTVSEGNAFNDVEDCILLGFGLAHCIGQLTVVHSSLTKIYGKFFALFRSPRMIFPRRSARFSKAL